MLHGFHFAFKMMQKRPLRMGLTLLQIAVGVAAVTIILSFVFSILNLGNSGENELIYMVRYGGQEIQNGMVERNWTESIFTSSIVKAIRQKSTELQGISIIEEVYGGIVESEGIRYSSREFIGVDVDFAKMVKLKMLEGSFFTSSDVDGQKPVIVISDVANQQLFGDTSGNGKILSFDNDLTHYEWKIIGIFSSDNLSEGSYVRPLHFVFPYSVVSANAIQDMQKHNMLMVRVKKGRITEGQDELKLLLNHELQSLGLQTQNENGELFFEKAFEQLDRKYFLRTFGLFFGSFAFVALVVSSIGILSMMLVSIVERTREIGLRRALGASRLSIVGQILAESVFISLIGGILGIVIAAFSVKPFVEELLLKTFFSAFLGSHASLSLYPVLISLSCAIIVGLLAGLYPGIRASRFVPVEAIREG